MKKVFIALLLILLIIFMTGCNQERTGNKLTVAVSIVPQETFVKAVAGDRVEVVTMIPPGNSPGNYAPSPQELTRFSNSSIYFSIGVPADITNILPKAREFNSDIKIIKVFEEVSKVYKDREFAPGKRDPHIWLSPKRVKIMIDIIARELSVIDKNNEKYYQQNAIRYKEKLDRLDQELKNSLEGVKNKTFLVYHPSFGYFADDYGLKMIAIEKDGKEATPKRLQEIIDIGRKEKIKAVFYQEEIDSKQSRVIADELGGKAIQVSPLAHDYIENLKNTAELFNKILK